MLKANNIGLSIFKRLDIFHSDISSGSEVFKFRRLKITSKSRILEKNPHYKLAIFPLKCVRNMLHCNITGPMYLNDIK